MEKRVELDHNNYRGRFYIGKPEWPDAEMTFVFAGHDRFIINHTAVGDEHRSKGYGKMMVLSAVEFAREHKVKIIPLCPFAKSVFEKTPEYADVWIDAAL